MGAKCCSAEQDELQGIKQNNGQNTLPGFSQQSQQPGYENSGKNLDTRNSSKPMDQTQESHMEDMDDDDQTENLMAPGKKISINDFQLISVIGRGSFGKVYLVRKKDSGLPFAMKILKKQQLLKKNLLIKTQAERDIFEKIKNPYIVQLHYAFQTETKLYFIIDFLNGGELFTYLRKDQKFNEKRAMLYAAEIIVAIGCLHEQNIIYRDLKPENVLLDSDGHIRITDFGLSKQGVKQTDLTHSFCGTPEYLAPEIIRGAGHSWGADWWSLGALLYEMLCGRPPHYNKDRQAMMKDIVDKPIPMKPYFSSQACDLLQKLFQRDPRKRIGADRDAQEIMEHPFFKDINWDDIINKRHQMPFRPKVKHAEDTSCIDTMFTREDLQETLIPENALSAKQKEQAHFDGFTYAPKNGPFN